MSRGNTGPDVPRGEAGKWLPGTSPNPSGRPRRLREIEQMLDDEFRTVESMRETFRILRKLALQGVTKDVWYRGDVVGQETEFVPAYMELWLNRMLGPVKEILSDSEIAEAMKDAPPEVIAFWEKFKA